MRRRDSTQALKGMILSAAAHGTRNALVCPNNPIARNRFRLAISLANNECMDYITSIDPQTRKIYFCSGGHIQISVPWKKPNELYSY